MLHHTNTSSVVRPSRYCFRMSRYSGFNSRSGARALDAAHCVISAWFRAVSMQSLGSRAFFSDFPGVASLSPYKLAAGSPPSLRDGDLLRPHRSPYCLRARSLGNLTEKCSSVPLSCSAPWVNALSNAALRARLPCIFQLPMMSLRVEPGIRGPNPATHPADLSAYVQGIPDIRS